MGNGKNNVIGGVVTGQILVVIWRRRQLFLHQFHLLLTAPLIDYFKDIQFMEWFKFKCNLYIRLDEHTFSAIFAKSESRFED
jgi:hypothetical protein